MVIKRTIEDRIEAKFKKGRAIIIYGPRRSGKTTLLQKIQMRHPDSVILNCDEPDVRQNLSGRTSAYLKTYFHPYHTVFIDEAQRVKNIGLTLKLIIDTYPDIQIVATGSSSFELSNKIVEPLTGRKYEFYLYPLSLEELQQDETEEFINRTIEQRIVLGMYPEVVKTGSAEILYELTKSYLFRDVFEFQHIKNPDILEKLLTALALQIGNEVSYNELSKLLEIDKKTVSAYIQLLQKAFIIFRLNPYSRNLRKEISKLKKIYFWDTGIRNALIKNINPLYMRQDTGALWENFLIAERLKFNSNHGIDKNYYFWRTHRQEEIDFIEEYGGAAAGYEMKWKAAKLKIPASFTKTYTQTPVTLINRESFRNFLTQG